MRPEQWPRFEHSPAMSTETSPAREAQRARTHRSTTIAAKLLVPRARPIPCTILALSTEGACLAVGRTRRIPVNLRIRAAGSEYRVRTTERGAGYVFVRFQP
jgi:hypothetical protein